ncbi:MAG: GAF domain-containing protein [Chloroflexi bacterium]|nr:GAF domain-containing protein [Chloroflexota bacterium]
MTSRLRELIGTLEQRVADRTKALATVAEISTAASTYNTEQEMLSTVVSLTQRLFGLYHAHVFVYDEENEELRIVACGWKEGDEHQGTHGTTAIPLNAEQSLVARAARTRQPVIVNDVHNEPGWLPNVLLPDSASELAVPLLIGEKVLGVLDVQSDRLNAFTPSDANVQTTLANQVAVALQNIQQYRKTEVLAAELAGFESAVSEAAIVATTDVTGKIETVNENLIRISQYSREELIGQDHRILNSGYHPKEFIRNLWATIANGKVWRGEIRNKAKDGSYYWVDTTISPVFNDLGKPIKYVSVRFDITPRKELELAVTKRATQVEALDAITQKIQSATKIETALQIAARELSHALGMKPTIVSIDLNTSPTKDDKEPQT